MPGGWIEIDQHPPLSVPTNYHGSRGPVDASTGQYDRRATHLKLIKTTHATKGATVTRSVSGRGSKHLLSHGVLGHLQTTTDPWDRWLRDRREAFTSSSGRACLPRPASSCAPAGDERWAPSARSSSTRGRREHRGEARRTGEAARSEGTRANSRHTRSSR